MGHVLCFIHILTILKTFDAITFEYDGFVEMYYIRNGSETVFNFHDSPFSPVQTDST